MYKLIYPLILLVAVNAKLHPVLQYDQAQIYVTLPITSATSDTTILSMGQKLIAALYEKNVNIVLHGYVTKDTAIQDRLRMQYIMQRLERRMSLSLPHVRFISTVIDEVYEEKLLPAWQVSVAKTKPKAYIAIIVQPIIN